MILAIDPGTTQSAWCVYLVWFNGHELLKQATHLDGTPCGELVE